MKKMIDETTNKAVNRTIDKAANKVTDETTDKATNKTKDKVSEEKWEDTLYRMAEGEQIVLPESMSARLEDVLCKLNGREEYDDRKRFHMNFKKSLILAASLVMLVSATAAASVGAVRERMEAMNREKIEEYFNQIYQTKIGYDNFNRPYTDEEKKRMEGLREAYLSEARFPKGELTMIEQAQDYRGRGVAFLSGTTTFFLPDEEMSDEELLQIIDFQKKRDYSLEKMNELIESKEAQMPVRVAEEEQTVSPVEIPAGEAVYEPTQEMMIPYTGELELDITIAAGTEELYLAGAGTVHKMAIGSSDSTVFFDDFDVETRILAMCQDGNGDLYMALWQWPDENDAEKRIFTVWVVDREGKLLRKLDLSPYLLPGKGYARRMAIDGNGYLYLNVAGLKNANESQECEILVLDREGGYVSTVSPEKYALNLNGGLGVGKDGKVYTQLGNFYDEADPKTRMGIASIDAKQGSLAEIYDDIMPENAIMIDIVAPGARSDFVLWGYDGIFTYNLGDEKAKNVLPAYEAPCIWEGVRACALPDGRIVFAEVRDYRREETPLGTRFYGLPDETYFYYVPGMDAAEME